MARSPGRPTKYTPAHAKKAAKLALLGLTDKQIAAALDISTATLHSWKKLYPSFLSSLNAGKEVADAEVVAALFQRAKGFRHPSVKIFADPKSGYQKVVRFVERYPPDTVACIFWLKNRQPSKFRANPDGSDGDNDHIEGFESVPYDE